MTRRWIAALSLLNCLLPSLELEDPPAHCKFRNDFREDRTKEVFQKALKGQVLRDRLLKTPWQSLAGLTLADFEEDVVLPDPTDFVTSIARYLLLEKLHDDDVQLYIDVLRSRPDHAMPIAYTPTVGFACQVNHIFIAKPRGLYLPVRTWLTEAESLEDQASRQKTYEEKLRAALTLCHADEAWPDLKPGGKAEDGYGAIAVITDSSRILGLGDQGAGGIGIPAGKISLYIAAAGFRYQRAVPIVVDFGIDPQQTKWFKPPIPPKEGERPNLWCSENASSLEESIIEGINFGKCHKSELESYFGCRGLRVKIASEADFEKEVVPFMDVFVKEVKAMWPKMVVQWEDWATEKASLLLKRHRHVTCVSDIKDKGKIEKDSIDVVSFNDDIQGTGSMLYGALLAAVEANSGTISEQRLFFVGAGSAGIGVADMVVKGMLFANGISPCNEEAAKEARKKFVIMGGAGVIAPGYLGDGTVEGMSTDQKPFGEAVPHYEKEEYRCPKKNFRPDGECLKKLQVKIIKEFKPSVLVGSTGVGGVFDEETLRAMKAVNWDRDDGPRQHPIIFALSNPMSSAECKAEDAYKYTDGTAIFAAGTKMRDYEQGDGKPTFHPSQANNFFVFPGVGYGASFGSFSKGVPEEVFLVASQTLASMVTEEEVRHGSVLPAVKRILQINGAVSNNILAYGERLKAQFAEADDPTWIKASSASTNGKGGVLGAGSREPSNTSLIVGLIVFVVVGSVGGYLFGMHQANSRAVSLRGQSGELREAGIELGTAQRKSPASRYPDKRSDAGVSLVANDSFDNA